MTNWIKNYKSKSFNIYQGIEGRIQTEGPGQYDDSSIGLGIEATVFDIEVEHWKIQVEHWKVGELS